MGLEFHNFPFIIMTTVLLVLFDQKHCSNSLQILPVVLFTEIKFLLKKKENPPLCSSLVTCIRDMMFK